MGLPNLFSKNLTKKNDLFILIVLTDQSIQAALWQVIDQKIVILNKSKVRFYSTQEEQLIQLDESLQDLGKKSEETDQVLFAFEPHWVENNAILESHEQELKKISESLSLEAIGFVLITEAIHQFLIKENSYLSSIVLYMGTNFLDLMVIKQGKTVGSLSVGRSQDIVSDVHEALARLEQNFSANGLKLPPNIILSSSVIDQEKLRLYQQQLFTLDWTEQFNFIQKPIIEVIDPDRLLEIIAKNCGEAIAQQIGIISVPSETETKASVLQSIEKEEKEESHQASFGVPISVTKEHVADVDKKDEDKEDGDKEEQQLGEIETKKDRFFNSGKKFLKFLPTFKKTKKDSVRTVGKDKKFNFKIIIILGVVVGVAASAIIYYFLLKNSYQVTLALSPDTKTIQQTATIILDPTIAASDPANNLLKASIVNYEVSDSQEIQTTGIKEVGEKARGEVVVFNKTDEEKAFSAGTVFKAESLEFEATEDFVVPAASVEETEDGDGEIREFGRVKITLTAKEIGAESNISNRTEFRIEDFSTNTYSARAEEDFSGGSSREIRVVSQEDHRELLVNLRQRLLKKAREELQENAQHADYVIPTEVYQVIEETYSNDIGEEVDKVSLFLTISLQGLTYTTDDLIALSQAVLENDVPQNYTFTDQEPTVDPRVITEEDSDRVILEAEISGIVKAMIVKEDLKEELVGLPVQEVQSQLHNLDIAAQVDFVFSPSLAASFFKSLPSEADRIVLSIN